MDAKHLVVSSKTEENDPSSKVQMFSSTKRSLTFLTSVHFSAFLIFSNLWDWNTKRNIFWGKEDTWDTSVDPIFAVQTSWWRPRYSVQNLMSIYVGLYLYKLHLLTKFSFYDSENKKIPVSEVIYGAECQTDTREVIWAIFSGYYLPEIMFIFRNGLYSAFYSSFIRHYWRSILSTFSSYIKLLVMFCGMFLLVAHRHCTAQFG